MTTKRRNPGGSGKGQDKPEGSDVARKSHFALAPSVDEPVEQLTPKALTKQEFGRRLQHLLNERNWSQSDLVRAVKTITGEEMGRDAVSTYINGRSFPTPKSLNLLTQALGVTREELMPNATMQAMNDEHPALELRAASGHPGKAWVRVNRMMSFETATEIVKLINDEDRKDYEGR